MANISEEVHFEMLEKKADGSFKAKISEEVHFEMLEKKADGSFKAKYPKIKSKSGVTFDEHLAEIATEDKSGHIEVLKILPGEILMASADKDFVFAKQLDYIKAKEFKAIRDCAIRVKFALQGYKGYGCVYINGVPKGQERYVASAGDNNEKTFVEDFLNIKKDDLIQLYVKGGDAPYSAKTRNFRIYCYYNVSSIATVQQD